jgi:tellurite resistance protein
MAINQEGLRWLFKEKYTFGDVPDADAYRGYLKSVMICVNGDNELSTAERDWIVGFASAYGASSSLVEELKQYEATDDIESVISQAPPAADHSRRYLIYDAINACSADGFYHAKEKETVAKMAAKLGIDADIVKQIEEICAEEARIREKRQALMYPSGAPL